MLSCWKNCCYKLIPLREFTKCWNSISWDIYSWCSWDIVQTWIVYYISPSLAAELFFPVEFPCVNKIKPIKSEFAMKWSRYKIAAHYITFSITLRRRGVIQLAIFVFIPFITKLIIKDDKLFLSFYPPHSCSFFQQQCQNVRIRWTNANP